MNTDTNKFHRVTFSASAEHRQKTLKIINELTDRWTGIETETRTDVIMEALEEFVEIHKDEAEYRRLYPIPKGLSNLTQKWDRTLTKLIEEAMREYIYLHQDEELPSSLTWIPKARKLSKKEGMSKAAVISLALKEFEKNSED